jgi:hypothetical protein
VLEEKQVLNNFFFFWIQGNSTFRKVYFVGSGEWVKPQLSQTLTRGACSDSNLRSAVQISSPLSSRYALLEDKCCITSTHNMFFFHFISPQHLLLQNIGSFMCMLSCFIQFSLAGHLVMQPWMRFLQILQNVIPLFILLHCAAIFISLEFIWHLFILDPLNDYCI